MANKLLPTIGTVIEMFRGSFLPTWNNFQQIFTKLYCYPSFEYICERLQGEELVEHPAGHFLPLFAWALSWELLAALSKVDQVHNLDEERLLKTVSNGNTSHEAAYTLWAYHFPHKTTSAGAFGWFFINSSVKMGKWNAFPLRSPKFHLSLSV